MIKFLLELTIMKEYDFISFLMAIIVILSTIGILYVLETVMTLLFKFLFV